MKKDKKGKDSNKSNTSAHHIGRRDIIKGLAAVPVLGAFSYAWLRKNKIDETFQKADP